MLQKIKIKLKKNTEIFALCILVFITVLSTSYYNLNKKRIFTNYKNTINNIYFRKTLNHVFDKLEPKFKKINHNISAGETFDGILESYSVSKKEISEIKKKLSVQLNLNKLTTNQKISFIIDQSNNLIKEFIIQISNTKKISLTRNLDQTKFDQKILVTKLNKKIIYSESIIMQSLYKSAMKQKIPVNTIIEFARIYGFQVDFQRDVKKRDSFQIMYEAFKNDKNEIIETGNIIFANLKLSGENNYLYYFENILLMVLIRCTKEQILLRQWELQ